MIAAMRRRAMVDFLLVAFSTTIIVVASWPALPPKQTVILHTEAGPQHYALPTDDPRLAKLRHQLENWTVDSLDATLAKTAWLIEVAEFYAAKTKPIARPSGDVVPVSYNEEGDASRREAEVLQVQHRFWNQVAADARMSLKTTKSKIDHFEQQLGPPPIELGEMIDDVQGTHVFLVGALIGMVVANGFAFWALLSPTIRLTSAGDEVALSEAVASAQLKLVVPAKWVRIHQPLMVRIRQASYAAIVCAALVCVLQ